MPDLPSGVRLLPAKTKTRRNLHPKYGASLDYDASADEVSESTASDSAYYESESDFSVTNSRRRSPTIDETCDPDMNAVHIHGWLHPQSMLQITLNLSNLNNRTITMFAI